MSQAEHCEKHDSIYDANSGNCRHCDAERGEECPKAPVPVPPPTPLDLDVPKIWKKCRDLTCDCREQEKVEKCNVGGSTHQCIFHWLHRGNCIFTDFPMESAPRLPAKAETPKEIDQAWAEIRDTMADDLLNAEQKKAFVISILKGQLANPPTKGDRPVAAPPVTWAIPHPGKPDRWICAHCSVDLFPPSYDCPSPDFKRPTLEPPKAETLEARPEPSPETSAADEFPIDPNVFPTPQKAMEGALHDIVYEEWPEVNHLATRMAETVVKYLESASWSLVKRAEPSPEVVKLLAELIDSVESLTKKEMGPPEEFKPGQEYQDEPDSREHKARFYAALAAIRAEFSRLQALAPSPAADLEAIWKAYQTGQGSADHTDKQVFFQVVGRALAPSQGAGTQGACDAPSHRQAFDLVLGLRAQAMKCVNAGTDIGANYVFAWLGNIARHLTAVPLATPEPQGSPARPMKLTAKSESVCLKVWGLDPVLGKDRLFLYYDMIDAPVAREIAYRINHFEPAPGPGEGGT